MELNNGTLYVMQKYENDLRNIHSVPILIQLGLISKPHEIKIYIYIYIYIQKHFGQCIVAPIEWQFSTWMI